MKTNDFIQDYGDEPKTVEREIHVWRLRLIQAQLMVWHYRSRQPRDRHFLGLPECPDLIACADKCEVIETRIRELKHRKRLHEDEQRRAA